MSSEAEAPPLGAIVVGGGPAGAGLLLAARGAGLLDALLALRAELNARSPEAGPGAFKLSVNDFVVKASAVALRRAPRKIGRIGIAVGLPLVVWLPWWPTLILAPGRLLVGPDAALDGAGAAPDPSAGRSAASAVRIRRSRFRARCWVTRTVPGVDRTACAVSSADIPTPSRSTST